MSLKIKIKEDFIQAMKNKETDKKVFLSVILGEIQNEEGRGTVTTDGSVLIILRKMEKSLKQTNAPESLVELSYMDPYLPKLMSEDQIRTIIKGYRDAGLTNTGQIMGQFSKEHKGLADMKVVSTIIAEA